MGKPFVGWKSPHVFMFRSSSGFTCKMTIRGERAECLKNDAPGEIVPTLAHWRKVAAESDPATLAAIDAFVEAENIDPKRLEIP